MLLIVGVASVSKCWRQKPQISLSQGVVVSQSTFHLVAFVVICDHIRHILFTAVNATLLFIWM